MFDCLCYSEGLFTTLDRAGASDDREFASADRRIAHSNHCFIGSQIKGNQLVRFGDADDFRDPGQIFETPAIDWTLISGHAYRGARGAGHRMRTEPDCLNDVDHCIDIARSGARFHYDQHIFKWIELFSLTQT